MKTPSNNLDNPTIRVYKFSNCFLDKIERKIFKDGELLDISPKAFDVLQLLVEKSGEVLTKDEILTKVWTDSFVEEGNLAVHISMLRRALGANKSEPYIATVSGSGYRFVSRVYPIDEDVWAFHLINHPRLNSAISGAAPEFNSIAVLPFRNENGDEDMEYLADGLTESIINNLSYIDGLRVLARNTMFSFKNKEIDIQEVGKKLGVSAILTGRIRVLRDNLIIGVELINAADGAQLWGTQFNEPFEDVFEVQEKITQAILNNLRDQIGIATKKSNASKITENTESYRFYLKGKYLFNKKSIKDINKAIECFHQSISLDPTNAHSYIELANCYLLLHFYEQKSHKDTINQTSFLLEKFEGIYTFLPELYVIRGHIMMFLEFNLQGAEKQFIKALALNPNSAEAYYRYSQLLIYSNRVSEALAQINNLTKVDPVSLLTNKNVSRMFYFMGQYQNAIIKLEECLELEPEDFETYLLLGTNLTELEKHTQALKAFQKSLDLQYHLETISMIGYTRAKAGNFKEAQKILKLLEENSKRHYISAANSGIIYSALGQTEKAFICLEKAFEEHYSDLIGLRPDPRWKSIKHDPRFNEMLIKIGLPVD